MVCPKHKMISLKYKSALLHIALVSALCLLAPSVFAQEQYTDEEFATVYIANISAVDTRLSSASAFASYASVEIIFQDRADEKAAFYNEIADEILKFQWRNFENETTRRLFWRYYTILRENNIFDDEDSADFAAAQNGMLDSYNAARVCLYEDESQCNLAEADVAKIIFSSEDPDELKYYWTEYTNTGANVRFNFTKVVDYQNILAQALGYETIAEYDVYPYTDIDLDYDPESDWLNLWDQIRPLYMELHAYVRKVLRDKYGSDIVSQDGPIPSHLLGDLYAQNWTKVGAYGLPYPDQPSIDINQALADQGYTVLDMIKTAEEFFTSMNMSALPQSFYEDSQFTAPTDGRLADCQTQAWEFFDGKSVRIAGCFSVNSYDFMIIHEALAYEEQYIAYEKQPYIFHAAPNPGFAEAISDVVVLALDTRKHLASIGLIADGTTTPEDLINYLYLKALELVAFIPYGLLLDTFRYNVYRGNTSPDDYNCHYNYLRETLQGVEPPGPRDETQFDAAARFEVAADYSFIRYYYTNILVFQFYEALCITAGEYDPNDASSILAVCDYYQSAAAGNKFTDMLELGISKPWPDALEVLTGQRNVLADGILEYFKPLYEYLKEANENNGETVGWKHSTVEYCTAQQLVLLGESGNQCYFERFQGIGA